MRNSLDHHLSKDGFRLRGTSMSRVDGFSDVVFGFALTLLVVSLEVPKTYAELHAALRQFLPFAVSFVFLIMLWFAHFRLFRRLGLEDHATVLTNAALLFVVLVYVYPLKFLSVLLLGGQDPSRLFESQDQVRELMTIYGLGFACVYFLLAALYWIGWQQRDTLALNSLERVLMKSWIADNLEVGSVGLVCVLLAQVLPARLAGESGLAFFLIVPIKLQHRFFADRRVRRARAELHRLQAIENTSG